MSQRYNSRNVPDLETALTEDAERGDEVVEIPLREKSFFYVGGVMVFFGFVVALRIFWIGGMLHERFAIRAKANAYRTEMTPAPRGIIFDRYGEVLAENKPSFTAVINVREFVKQSDMRDATLKAIRDITGVSEDDMVLRIKEREQKELFDPLVVARELTQSQVVAIKASHLAALDAEEGFERAYRDPYAFSHVVGYVGLPTSEDLLSDEAMLSNDLVGQSGIEFEYDGELRGNPGMRRAIRNAKGEVIQEDEEHASLMGKPLTLTIDAGLQEYFFRRLKQGLVELGRTSGVGIALDPRNGEILALISLPSFDANTFSSSGSEVEKREVLNSSGKPFFNRALSGMYTPGSTIKPLHAVAALAEGVIDSQKTVFSPGYLDIPNPYDREHPTRYVDWRYQGYVDLSSAIAQSSNVYFYTVGGGAGGMRGLGISRLREWWERFGLGEKTGVALPGEAAGFLPSPEWKEKTTDLPWLLGDTYNVSIGQGDLLVTPLQIVRYIAGIANGGILYVPKVIAGHDGGRSVGDLSAFAKEIQEVQRGMRETVTASLGTAHSMDDLPIRVAGKTGSSQIANNTQENAFFVGYAPYDDPKIVVLVLVERAKQGSLNAVPVAKDVFLWYYKNRLTNN